MSRVWTLLPYFCGKRAYLRTNLLSTVGLLCALLLPGCGESTPKGYEGSPTSETSDTLQPIVAPPYNGERPAQPGTTGTSRGPDGLPLLQPPKGVNTALFAEKMDDEDSRMDRLENAVQELRNDFDAMSPAIVRLVAIEGDIQNLISQLQVLTGGSPQPAEAGISPIDEAALDTPQPAQPAEVPAVPAPSADSPEKAKDAAVSPLSPSQPAPFAQETAVNEIASGAPAPEATPPPPVSIGPPAKTQDKPPLASKPSTDGASVEGLRVGEHPGKVRMVMDVRGKTSFTTDLDNKEKILVIELPDAAWNHESQKSFDGNPLLSTYRTEKLGDHGTMLIVQLKGASSITYKSAVDNADGQGQRIIIDLSVPK